MLASGLGQRPVDWCSMERGYWVRRGDGMGEHVGGPIFGHGKLLDLNAKITTIGGSIEVATGSLLLLRATICRCQCCNKKRLELEATIREGAVKGWRRKSKNEKGWRRR